MQIKSINTFSYNKQINFSPSNAKEVNNTNVSAGSEPVYFENYGRTLVSKPSFKKSEEEDTKKIEEINARAFAQIEETDLSRKISSLASMVKKPNVVLVGNDEKKDLELLSKHTDSYYMDFLINKIYYINDKDADFPLLVIKDKDGGSTHIAVLDKEKTDFLSKKGSQSIDASLFTFEPLFALSRNGSSLLIKTEEKNENIKNPEHKVIELINENNIKQLNKTAIDNLLGGGEKKVSTKEKQDSRKVRNIITFNDIGGLDNILERIKKEILYPIKMPFAYEKRKKIDHGTILYGIPGTGKSMIGEALANEAGVNFIKINASELESMYVGETERHWRKLFDRAVQQQPSIIFIDEFDAVAKTRGGADVYGDKALNTILSLMSNLEKNDDKVFVIAATNNMGAIDSAALRKGRFGNHIQVPKPDLDGCYIIFKKHSKNMKIEDDFIEEAFAKKLFERRATGSDIASVIDKAWDEAYERLGIFKKMENNTLTKEDIDKVQISHNDFYSALNTVLPIKTQEN